MLGPLVAISFVLVAPPAIDTTLVLEAVLLVVLGAIGERFQLHLTHKTQLTLTTTACFAMIMVLPAALPGLLALVAAGIGQLSLIRARRDPIEALFNMSQQALHVAVAALVFAATRDIGWLGPEVGPFGAVGAIISVALLLHGVNAALIAICAALQLGQRPWRILAVTFHEDFTAHIVMCTLGLAAAYIAVTEPVMVPVLALPTLMVRRAIAANVQLREDTHAALANMVEAIELRDPYTAGHSRRVATLARTLALNLGLTHEEADMIESAGLVHDIGKIAIDPAVLTKPGKLTAEERREIERHPVLGAAFIGQFSSYQAGIPLIRHHHEAWDGSGYPDGLSRENIPVGARILAVADTFDALTSDRPYRTGMTVDQARRILADGANEQWDPDIITCLLQSPLPGQQLASETAVDAAPDYPLAALRQAS
jgi:HD-GYP domain-containing protein (c-di-GMP phosphodiesterase class II)